MAVQLSQQLPSVAEHVRDSDWHYLFTLTLSDGLQVDYPRFIEISLVLDRTSPRRSLLLLPVSTSWILQAPPVPLSLLIAASVL